jgi:predicted RNase H-like HicB family nuclease
MRTILISRPRRKKYGWYAELKDKPSVFALGRTAAEAIGKMVEACPDAFKVVIKEGEPK